MSLTSTSAPYFRPALASASDGRPDRPANCGPRSARWREPLRRRPLDRPHRPEPGRVARCRRTRSLRTAPLVTAAIA